MRDKGEAYSGLIEAEVQAELNRKTAMDARAASLIATSGGLVTILAAVSAFVGSDRSARLPWYASVTLLGALLAFAFASLAGIMAGRLMRYRAPKIESLNAMVGDHWDDDERGARRAVATVRITMVESLRDANDRKGGWIYAGWWAQAAALGLLAVVVMMVIVAP